MQNLRGLRRPAGENKKFGHRGYRKHEEEIKKQEKNYVVQDEQTFMFGFCRAGIGRLCGPVAERER